MECEELGCVVGGPFKPNKLREVRGLVRRPWINKPSEMTMRCADICHHAAPASKHKPAKPSLPPLLLRVPLSHTVPSLPSIPLFVLCVLISLTLLFFFHFPLNTSVILLRFICFPPGSCSCSSSYLLPPPFLSFPISIPPFHASPVTPSIHPFIHPSIHAWLAGCPSGAQCVLQAELTEPLWHSGVAQQRGRPGFRPGERLFIQERVSEGGSKLHLFFVSPRENAKTEE